MKTFLSTMLAAALLSPAAGAQSVKRSDYPIQGVPFTKVTLTDNFWQPRLKTNTAVTIPASFQRCEATNRVKNFEMAAAKSGKFATVFAFDDTDIYKPWKGPLTRSACIPTRSWKRTSTC
ncbi:beta-L-arabinofuranosidase domain-containing protein [Hymenobacter sp. B1770]|uniref:beta-L-arabinofuranosidase domain-containing protein n=1 Tax=Hymenobacter sp. B1770 TaxID=1718788 RepID=UPI003CF2417F